MYVKKRMSLLLFAALAMVLFTACGRWDFSREAAKAANEAQNAVVFEASSALAQSLKDALEDKVQVSNVEAAMEADERLDDLLGRLDVYAVEGDDAEAAAQTIADSYIKHISGRKSDGHIAMVKADNGWFYAAVVTTTTGGSGSDDSNSGSTTPDPDPGDGGDGEGGEEQPGTKIEYTVSWTAPENGTITVKTSDGDIINNNDKVTEDTTITITVTADDGYEVTSVKAGGTELEGNGTYTHAVSSDVEITATITEKTVKSIEVVEHPEELTCYNTLDCSQIKIKVTYDDDTTRVISASDVGVTVEHVNQSYTIERGISKIIRELAKDTDYQDEVNAFLDKFAVQVENKLEVNVEWIGIIPVDADIYWNAKFNISYQEKQDSINVKLTCSAASSDIGTVLCEYCPNWDGETNTAPSTRSLQSAHFETES